MSMRYLLSLCLMLFLSLAACAQTNNTYVMDAKTRDDVKTCKTDASSIVGGVANSSNLQWAGYFTMCMKTRFGYTNAELRKIWY